MAGVVRVMRTLPTDLPEWDRHQRQLHFKGEFVARLLGCATTPEAPARYWASGGIVVLQLPALSGTSTGALAFISGLPGAITPVRDFFNYVPITDNGATALGLVHVSSDTGITLGVGITGSLGGFTGSGTKGIGSCVVTYALD